MNEPLQVSGLRAHHKEAIDNLVERFQENPDYLAVIIAGSVAKGIAREDSDVDCYLVVTDEVFQMRKQQDDLFYYATEGCNYEGGYYDGKIINYDFVQAAADRGSEPTRASFDGAIVAFSRIPELSEVVSRIAVYPEHNRIRNFADFYAQVALYGGYFSERALALNNSYLLSHAVSQVALFGGRLILAYNRILFPCHKSFMHVLQGAPEKPEGYLALMNAMLATPTGETIRAFVDCITSFYDWGLPEDKAVSRFVVNNEWNWLESEPPLSDR
ncbi:nucleotidyltransferase domain-containing protein [Paenibacillus mendelii]|uniref:Nucleotidyltransferase domain-containing protein n=1 Tax=Paenibacillus mendelii TaxID=206163 RepID=A0ABV6JF88_9BACL|nr:nucleotidyltransferase domain-containing protein [Paenibacillus mendelii]MCQ6557458.1 nucleotidyltransferase domain-containing protein [Paenibacillus mendelii]